MTLPDQRARLDLLLRQRPLKRLLAILNTENEETRIVGGAIRNALLGRPVTEVDLATTAEPETVSATALAADLKVAPTGIDHGTVTVVVDGMPFEVTTLREDVETFGRRATVRFGRDFAADARRRDFTINALSLGADGSLHDYVGGLADLEAGRVAFIGDPAARIREDYLRVLRFFRFYAEYGLGDPDHAGLHAAIHARSGLAILSRERVRAELLKLLAARRAVEAVALLSETGFLQQITGGIGWLGRFSRMVAAEEGTGTADAVARLGSLCVAVVEDAERLRERLRLSNAEHDRLALYARALEALRSIEGPLDASAIRRAVAEFGIDALRVVLGAVQGEPRPTLSKDGQHTFRRISEGAEPAPVFPLRGADLLAAGVPAGPGLGALLDKARALWLAEGCPADRTVKLRLVEAALAAEGSQGPPQAGDAQAREPS